MSLRESRATRNILNLIRESEESSNLVDVTPDEFNKAESELRDNTRDRKAKITSFKVYPDQENVIIVATLPSLGDASVQFIYNENNGIFLNSSNIKLSPENLGILNGLTGYYENFEKEWEAKLKDEYKG